MIALLDDAGGQFLERRGPVPRGALGDPGHDFVGERQRALARIHAPERRIRRVRQRHQPAEKLAPERLRRRARLAELAEALHQREHRQVRLLRRAAGLRLPVTAASLLRTALRLGILRGHCVRVPFLLGRGFFKSERLAAIAPASAAGATDLRSCAGGMPGRGHSRAARRTVPAPDNPCPIIREI